MAGKIFKFLPKAASFSIPNHNNNNNNNKYMFSGPILPMIPDHCRRKSNEMLEEEEEELTSPKVSCMGQVRNHNKTNSNRKKKDMKTKTKTKKKASLAKKEGEQQQQKKKEAPNHTSSLGRLFWRKVTPARRGVDSSDDEVVVATEITRMRRYASGRRETLKDFDWRTTITQNKAEEEEEEEAALVPHSAPILVIRGGDAAEPKKEINIWMRRARAPPIPLQLN